MRKYKKEWHRAEERLAASGGGVRRAVCGGWRAAGGGAANRRAVRIIGDVLRSKRPQTARPQDRKMQDRKTARPQNSARVSDIFKKLTY